MDEDPRDYGEDAACYGCDAPDEPGRARAEDPSSVLSSALSSALSGRRADDPAGVHDATPHPPGALMPTEGVDLIRTLRDLGRSGSATLRGPAATQLAGTLLPAVGTTVGGIYGGPLGGAVGSRLGQAAAGAIQGRATSAPKQTIPPAASPPAASPPAASPAQTASALRLFLDRYPDVVARLLAAARDGGAQSTPPTAPGGAPPTIDVMTLLGALAGQAAEDAPVLHGPPRRDKPVYDAGLSPTSSEPDRRSTPPKPWRPDMTDYLYDNGVMEDIMDDFTEDDDYYPEDLGYDYPEVTDYDEAAEARSGRRRRDQERARARMLARARRGGFGTRRSPARRGSYFTPSQPVSTNQVHQGFSRVGTDVHKIETELRHVDLDAKVQADQITRALKSQSARISGSEYAMTASLLTSQLTAQFPDLVSHPLLKTAIPLLPLFLLKPQRRGITSDPRFVGVGLAFGLLGLQELLDRNRTAIGQAAPATAGIASGTSQNGTLTQGELAALSALLNRLAVQVAHAAQVEQAAQVAQAAQLAETAHASQASEALQNWIASLVAQGAPTAEGPVQASAEGSASQKAKASSPKGGS